MIKYLIILLLILCTSCHTPAWLGTFREISRTKYDLNTNNCLDKSQAFQAARGGVILHINLADEPVKTHAVSYFVAGQLPNVHHDLILDCTSGRIYRVWVAPYETIQKHYGGRIIHYNYIEGVSNGSRW